MKMTINNCRIGSALITEDFWLLLSDSLKGLYCFQIVGLEKKIKRINFEADYMKKKTQVYLQSGRTSLLVLILEINRLKIHFPSVRSYLKLCYRKRGTKKKSYRQI